MADESDVPREGPGAATGAGPCGLEPAALIVFAAGILRAAGLPEADAALVARALVQADLEGVGTHGLGRLPNYVARLRGGLVNPRPRIAIVREQGATCLLDGDNGMGQVVATRAMAEAIRRAREHGIGCVGVRRSNHLGAAAFYCQMAVAEGMIGLACSNSPPGMAPWGGRRPFLGTNPLAFGFPAGRRAPVIVDFATSVASRGQVLEAARAARTIPPGWAIDAEGRPTEDPQAALAGALLPMGGPKGYALAVAVEVLSAVLTGAGVGPGVASFFDNWAEPSNVGHLLAAIDIAAFADPAVFAARMEALVGGLKAVPPAAGSPGVQVPGERRAARAAEAAARGLHLPPVLLAELGALAAELGAPPLRR